MLPLPGSLTPPHCQPAMVAAEQRHGLPGAAVCTPMPVQSKFIIVAGLCFYLQELIDGSPGISESQGLKIRLLLASHMSFVASHLRTWENDLGHWRDPWQRN